MEKEVKYKCPECGKEYKSIKMWGNHILSEHPDVIPPGYSFEQYAYFLRTGKAHGICVVCKSPTKWNPGTNKYSRFCENPKCKEEYREMFKNRMINKYGKVHLLNDPEKQRQMLSSKKMSGKYKFKDGSEVEYVGTYEKDFLHMLDTFLHLNGTDIMSPSPHTYYYDYKNPNEKDKEGRKFYIPDFYIPSINLEIEIKQSTNKNPEVMKTTKVKEILKDEMMKNNSCNYFKVLDKDYTDFFKYVMSISKLEDNIATEAVQYNPISYSLDKVKLNIFKEVFVDKYNIYETTKEYKLSHLVVRVFGKQLLNYKDISGFIYSKDNNKYISHILFLKVDNITWITDINVVHAERRCGIARQMVTRASKKYKNLQVKVNSKDTVSVDLFLKCGFEIVQYGKDFIHLAKI